MADAPEQLKPFLFEKGHAPKSPGRPKGAVSKITRAAKEWAEAFLNGDEEYRIMLESRLREGKAPLVEKYLWERIVGKPKEHIEITTTGPLFQLNDTKGPKEE